jgi:hypothetical protein
MKVALIVVAALLVVVLGYWFLARPWYLRWGATDAELAMRLPGDEIVPDQNSVSTRAITVHAPAAKVYPWLVQVGQGRGGMYSYEWLENLIGCDMHNVYQIEPALQQVSVGQPIRMGPKGYPMYHVAGFDPGKYFVMRPADPKTETPGPGAWSMAVVEQPDGASRLIFRQMMRVDPGIGNFVMWRVMIDPITFVMEQKMMRTIRDLAEQAG